MAVVFLMPIEAHRGDYGDTARFSIVVLSQKLSRGC